MQYTPPPWEDVEHALADPPALTDEQSLALVEAIPDDARAVMLTFRDPDAVARYARDGRAVMVDRVRELLLAQQAQRLDVPHPTPAVVAPETRLAADIVDVLEAVRSIADAGIGEAKAHALDCLDEVTNVKPVGTTSLAFPDQHGREVKVTAEQATRLEVDVDEVLEVLATVVRHQADDAALAADVDAWGDREREAFLDGARRAMRALLGLVTPTWRATALKALAADLARIDDQEAADLAVRLELAQRRAPVGNLRVKITRTEEKGTTR